MMTRLTAVDLFVWHESLGGGRRATIDVLIRCAGGSYSYDASSGSLFQVLVLRYPSGLSPCLVHCPCLGGVFSCLAFQLKSSQFPIPVPFSYFPILYGSFFPFSLLLPRGILLVLSWGIPIILCPQMHPLHPMCIFRMKDVLAPTHQTLIHHHPHHQRNERMIGKR